MSAPVHALSEEPRIRTGDSVYVASVDETWLVAFADYDRDELVCCGWPLSLVKIGDCKLVKACTDEEHLELLGDLADMNDQSDMRCRWARRQNAPVRVGEDGAR